MELDRTRRSTKYADGYTGVLSAEALRDWVRYSAGSCRQKQPASIRARFEQENGTNPEELLGATHAAKEGCPVSKVLNAEITLEARLVD